MNVLEDLYYGRISPWECFFEKDSHYGRLVEKLSRLESDFRKKLNESEKNLYEEISNIENDLHTISEEGLFEQGFRLGAKFILEIYSGSERSLK